MPKKHAKKHHRDASSAAERSKAPEQPRVQTQDPPATLTSHHSGNKPSNPHPHQLHNPTPPANSTAAPICPPCARDTTPVPNPTVTRQLQTDRIASLKLSTKDFETENVRLKDVSEGKKKELAEKTNQLRKMVGKNEFKKRMREVAKKRKNKGSAGGGV